jgi:isopentenyl-diphosphate delta-isomerase
LPPEEQVDILTRSGNFTGVRAKKSEVHRRGLWHRASHVWVATSDRRLLLQRRALTKENWPGLWDVSIAGHLSAGESAVDAAVREAQEEIGLTLSPGELQQVATLQDSCVLRDGTYIDNEIHEIFLVRRDVSLEELRFNDGEVMDAVLVPVALLSSYELVPHEGEYALICGLV